MTLPFAMGTLPLPAWIPGWVPVVLLIPLLLYGLLALLVPFSTFGVKGRLDGIEARIDELHAEIRTLSLRMPPGIGEGFAHAPELEHPPVPPVTRYAEPASFEARARLAPERGEARGEARAPRPDSRPARAEPRLGPR